MSGSTFTTSKRSAFEQASVSRVQCEAAAEFDHTHAACDALLKQHVRDGWVNYSALKADPKPLGAYLDSLAAVQRIFGFANCGRSRKLPLTAILLPP